VTGWSMVGGDKDAATYLMTLGEGEVVPPPVHAKGADEFVIAESDDEELAGYHSVIFDGTNFMVAYVHSESTASDSVMYARLFDTAGSPVGSPVYIDGSSLMEGAPMLSFNGNESLLVSGTGWPPNYIQGQFITTAGGLGTGPFTVAGGTNTSWDLGGVAFDGTNHLVVWSDDDGGGDFDIYGQLVTQAGGLSGGVITINADAGNQQMPKVAFGGGKYLVTFVDNATDVSAQLVTTVGGMDGGKLPLHTDGLPSDNDPYVIWNGLEFLVAYHNDNGTDWDILGATVSTAGLFGSDIPLMTGVSDDKFPAVVWDGAEYIMVWTEGLGMSTASVKVQRFSSDLTPQGSSVEQAVPVTGKTPWAIGIATAAPGKYFAAMNREDIPGDLSGDNDNDVYGLFLDTGAAPAPSTYTFVLGGSNFDVGVSVAHDGTRNDYGTHVEVDTHPITGNAFVLARSTSGVEWDAPDHSFIIKYSSEGVFISSKPIEGRRSGNIMLAGPMTGGFIYTDEKFDAGSAVKIVRRSDADFSSAGETAEYPDTEIDHFKDIETTGSEIFACAKGGPSGSTGLEKGAKIFKYGLALNEMQRTTFTLNAAYVDCHALEVYGGDVYVLAGNDETQNWETWLLKYDSALSGVVDSVNVTAFVGGEDQSLVVTDEGIYISTAGENGELHIYRYNAALDYTGISATFSVSGTAGHAQMKYLHDIYVVTTATGLTSNEDFVALRFDPADLSLVSSATYDAGILDFDIAFGFDIVDEDLGDLVVVGGATNGSGDFDVLGKGMNTGGGTPPITPTGVTRVWTGSSPDDFATSALNWAGGLAPQDGDSIEFSMAGESPTMDLTVTIASMSVLSPFDGTITFSNGLTLLKDFYSNATAGTVDFGGNTINVGGDFEVVDITLTGIAWNAVFNGDTDQQAARYGGDGYLDFVFLSISKQTGTALNMGSNSRVLGTFTMMSGTYSAAGFTHELSGDFSLQGGYLSVGQSTIAVVGGNEQTFSATGGASSDFNVFSVLNQSSVTLNFGFAADTFRSTAGYTFLWFGAGNSYSFDKFIVRGSTGPGFEPKVKLKSSTPGTQWDLGVNSYEDVSMVVVRDCNAMGGIMIDAEDSFNDGNNMNWSFANVGGGFLSLTFDDAGDLWALNDGAGDIRKYVSPVSPITEATTEDWNLAGLEHPENLRFDTGGNLWVSVSTAPGAYPNLIVKYAKNGSVVDTSTSTELSAILNDVSAISFRSDTGDMWVVNRGAMGSEASVVQFYNTGSLSAPAFDNSNVSTFTLSSELDAPRDIAFDTGSNLWVTLPWQGEIRRYPRSGSVI
ncbi:hypothetical protein ACFL2T_06560, partial [Elusimicrobiota bacterium]